MTDYKFHLSKMIANIMQAYNMDDLESNKWYNDANLFCKNIADIYGLPLDRVVAVVAVLSPNVGWNQNKKDAITIIDAFNKGGFSLASEVTVTAYGTNHSKALNILDDCPIFDNLRGMKVVAFYHNILNPTDNKHVTIDRHAVTIALGNDIEPYKSITRKRNRILQEAYKIVADIFEVLPHEVQANTWVNYRRLTFTDNELAVLG